MKVIKIIESKDFILLEAETGELELQQKIGNNIVQLKLFKADEAKQIRYLFDRLFCT